MKVERPQSMADQIVAKIRRRKGVAACSSGDFAGLGKRAAIDQALSRLAKQGRLQRLGHGLYIYPRKSPRTGEIQLPSADAVARAYSRKRGQRIWPSRVLAANALRLSTQVPARNIYVTDGRTRTVRVGPHTLYFRQGAPSALAAKGRAAIWVVQALKDLGRKRISNVEVRRLRRLLPDKDRRFLLQNVRLAPEWMQPILTAIAQGAGNGSHGSLG